MDAAVQLGTDRPSPWCLQKYILDRQQQGPEDRSSPARPTPPTTHYNKQRQKHSNTQHLQYHIVAPNPDTLALRVDRRCRRISGAGTLFCVFARRRQKRGLVRTTRLCRLGPKPSHHGISFGHQAEYSCCRFSNVFSISNTSVSRDPRPAPRARRAETKERATTCFKFPC